MNKREYNFFNTFNVFIIFCEYGTKGYDYEIEANATFEGAFYRIFSIRENLNLTKKQNRILVVARQKNGKNEIFNNLKKVTRITAAGTFEPWKILKALQKNEKELTIIARKKKTPGAKMKKVTLEGEIAGKEKAEQIIKDLKVPEKTFYGAIKYLYAVKDHVKMSKKQVQILRTVHKTDNITHIRLKNLIKLNPSDTCSPFNVLKGIRENQAELNDLANGIPIRDVQKKMKTEENSKPLPLDTNYKYPTKTSNSIWTVKNKPKSTGRQ